MEHDVENLTLENKIVNKIKESMHDLVTDEDLIKFAQIAIKETISNLIKEYNNDNYYSDNPFKQASRKIINNAIKDMENDKELRCLIGELFITNLPYLLMECMKDEFHNVMKESSMETERKIMTYIRSRF